MLSDAIGHFAVSGGIDVERDTGGTWSNGRYTEGTRTTTSGVEASVQPLRGQEIENLPEGDRSKRSIKIYTKVAMIAADRTSQVRGDRFTWDADTFEVIQVEKHTFGEYWKSIAVRVGD